MSIFQVPEEDDLNNLDPIVAGLFGRAWGWWQKYTSDERRANAEKQLRDRYGRFADMGKSSKFNIKDESGAIKSRIGKYIGLSDIKDHGRFLVQEPGKPPKIYHIASSNFQQVAGVIDTEYLKGLGLLNENGEPDDAKIGDNFQDIKDVKIEDAAKDDEVKAGIEIPDLPNLADSVKGKKANPTKLRNLLPGVIVKDLGTGAHALVTDTETKDGETTAYLRFQNGERRVTKGSANESVLAWVPKGNPPQSKEEQPEVDVTKLQEVAVTSDRIRIGDRVFDNGSESYATIEAIAKSADGKTLDIKIRFADGRTQVVSRPISKSIFVWREPNLGSEGKSSEQLAELPETAPEKTMPGMSPMKFKEKKGKEKKEQKSEKVLPPLPKNASPIDRAIWELERTGKNPSLWNLLWVFPNGIPVEKSKITTTPILDALRAKHGEEESVSEDDLRMPVTVSEVTGEALDRIKQLKGMGGKVKDMLPEDEAVFDAAIRTMLGSEASPAEIAATKDLVRKKAKDDTREFKVLRVGHNFFVRYREGDDLGPEKLATYLKQVANLASKVSLGETPIFIDLLNEMEIGVGDHILRPGKHGKNILFGYNYYDPIKGSEGMHISINTSQLGKTPDASKTVYHETGHGVHYIMTDYKRDANSPMALKFRKDFEDEIVSLAPRYGGDKSKAEKELFADKFADLSMAMFEGKTELLDPKFLDFYNDLISRSIADTTYNSLTRELMGDPVETPGPGKSGLATEEKPKSKSKRKVRTADTPPLEAGIGDSIWTTAVSGELENLQIGDVDSESDPKTVTLLVKDSDGKVIGKAVVPISEIYNLKENVPTQKLDGPSTVEDVLAAFDAQNPNFDETALGALNGTTVLFVDGRPDPKTRTTENYTRYAGGSLWVRPRPEKDGALDENGNQLFEALAWTNKGQPINGYRNNEFVSTSPREALRGAAQVLADYNAENGKADKIEATVKSEGLTSLEDATYNPTKAETTLVEDGPGQDLPVSQPEPESEPEMPSQVIKTADNFGFKFFEDGGISGIEHSNPSLFIPTVDASGQVIVRSINIKSAKTSPHSYISTDAEGNLTHTSVNLSTGEVSEVSIGNIGDMFSDKEKARAVGNEMAKSAKATISAEPKEPSKGALPPKTQHIGLHGDVKSLLSKISDDDSFRVDGGKSQTDSILNFNGEGKPTNGGFGGFTFQPDPNSSLMVSVIVDPSGNEITRFITPAGVRPLTSNKKVAKAQLAQGVASASRGSDLDEMSGDILTSDDAYVDMSGLDYSSESTDYRAKKFDLTSSDTSSSIDEMISRPWSSRSTNRRTIQTSNKTYDEDNPYERLHPGALVLDTLTDRVGRVRGRTYQMNKETGVVEPIADIFEVEFYEGPASAISGVPVSDSEFNELGQRTTVVGKVHPTTTGSDFDDRRFYTVEIREPEDFIDVTKSFIADSDEGPVLVHDSAIGVISGTNSVARVAGYSSEGNLIVSIEYDDGSSEFKEIPVSNFRPLALGTTDQGSHGSVIGGKYAADKSINPNPIGIVETLRIVGTLNNMGFLDEDVARALIRSITGGYTTNSGLRQVYNNAAAHESIRKAKAASGSGRVVSSKVSSLGNSSSPVLENVLTSSMDPNGGEPPITVSEVVESDTVSKPSNRQLKSVERRLATPGVVSEERAAEIWESLPLLNSVEIGPVIQELDNAEILHRITRKMPVDDIFDRRRDAAIGLGIVKLTPEVAEKLADYAPDVDLDGRKLETPIDKIEPPIDEMSNEEMARDSKELDGVKLSDEQEEVFRLVEDTHSPIMITGKAGTGKSTLLKFIKKYSKDSDYTYVVAPSGMAALNAEGITIPRLIPGDFNIPYWAQDPHEILYGNGANKKGIDPKRLRRLQNLKRLIIDEISMVNADTLDHIDRILRAAKLQPSIPFGGVQLVMFGDPYQLPPVVRENDTNPNSHAATFREDYQSPWFFHANVWGYQDMNRVQLTQVFRQKDPEFKDLLNAVRNGSITDTQLERLNEIGSSGDIKKVDSEVVRLFSKRANVFARNTEMLDSIPGDPVIFKAVVEGRKTYAHDDVAPAPLELALKVGAKILFLHNGSKSAGEDWVNGDTARITAIGKETVMVKLDRPDSNGNPRKPVLVKKQTFTETTGSSYKQVSSSGNAVYNKVRSVSSSDRFTQFPFQLGYAITIHKSQGQTYDEAVVDASDVFAAGQLYVAISRVRSPEGLHLSAPITRKNVMVDPEVNDFMYELEFNPDGSPITEEQTAPAPAPAPASEPSKPTKRSIYDIEVGDVIDGKSVADVGEIKFSKSDVLDYVAVRFTDGTSKIFESDQSYDVTKPDSNVDEMSGDFTPLPEPFDPSDKEANAIEISGIVDPTKNIHGESLRPRDLDYIQKEMAFIKEDESALADLKSQGPSLFEGDDERRDLKIDSLQVSIKLRRKFVAEFWNSLEENIVVKSKKRNTKEAVMSRVVSDEDRTATNIPAASTIRPEEATKYTGRVPFKYSTKTYTDQYGRKYQIATIVYSVKNDGSTYDFDSPPVSFTVAMDMSSPEFDELNAKWNETIKAANEGHYELNVGSQQLGVAGYLTAHSKTIAMINTDVLYTRRGIATAMLEIARESYGSKIHHSSNITDAAQAWSDVVDADAPDLRDQVPDHRFEEIDEMSSDTDYLPEPYDPLDPGINPIEVLSIGAVLEGKGLDGRMLRQNDWLNDAIPQIKSKEDLLSKMKSDLSKNPDDENLKDAIGSVDLDLKILRDNVARVYLALEQNIRVTSKPKNTRDAVMARVVPDDSRTVDSLPPITENAFWETSTLTTLPLRYSTREYTDQYGRKYLIGTIVAKDAEDRDQFEGRSRYPHSFVFALDMQHPLFERSSRQWNETIEAANNGEYGVYMFSGTVGSLSVQNRSISLISIEPLYQRRGLGTALLEIARENYTDFDGTNYEINHSSTISHPARAWSDVVDADAPDLRDQVPAHRFDSIDEMSSDWSPIEGLTSGKGTSETLDRAINGDYLDLKAMELATEVPMVDVDMFSDDDIDGLLWYTSGSYRQINKIMRGIDDPEMHEDKRSRLLEIIDKLTKAIDDNGDVEEPYRVFRGETRSLQNNIDGVMNDLQPGDVVEYSAFTSTSAYPYPAFSGFGPGFADPRNRNNAAAPGGSGATFWAIDIPAGAKAMRVPNVTSNTHEAEVILPANTKFRIKAIRRVPQIESLSGTPQENGRFNYYIDAEVLNVAKDWTPTEGVGTGLGVEKSPE